VEYFVGHFAKESGNTVRHIDKQTLGQLQAYRANLKKHPPKRGVSALDDREMEMIEAALAETHGRIPGPNALPRNSGYLARRSNRRSGGWASTSMGRSDSPINVQTVF
jgi:hypothetical protein